MGLDIFLAALPYYIKYIHWKNSQEAEYSVKITAVHTCGKMGLYTKTSWPVRTETPFGWPPEVPVTTEMTLVAGHTAVLEGL